MVIRKKTSFVAAPAKFSAPAPVAPAAPTPVARSETKGSGTLVATKPVVSPGKTPTYQQIAERAHQIYLKRGFGPGNATSDWLEAERQLKSGR